MLHINNALVLSFNYILKICLEFEVFQLFEGFVKYNMFFKSLFPSMMCYILKDGVMILNGRHLKMDYRQPRNSKSEVYIHCTGKQSIPPK